MRSAQTLIASFANLCALCAFASKLLPGARPIHITEKKAARLRDRIPPQAEWREWEAPFDADPDYN